jgi:uncharacterized damage-inducible protein DinB
MKPFPTLLTAALLLTATTAFAHPDAEKVAPKAGGAGIKAEFARNLDYAGDKLIQLAEAVPAEKYTWRPAEGVRSFSEVFLHAAGGNYMIPSFTGAKLPDGFDPKTFETSTTKKDEIIAQIKKSLEFAKAAANAIADSDMDTSVKWFLGEGSKREILFFTSAHDHEHLGQLIAYSRMNGITPPWSKKD